MFRTPQIFAYFLQMREVFAVLVSHSAKGAMRHRKSGSTINISLLAERNLIEFFTYRTRSSVEEEIGRLRM
ncbi:MAG: hypothetical protein QOI77_368 [Blastocatellia bacterium]|jgi:hypothetical protein|nr:hypothetical protein [Blastocatellia bacterium]